MRRQRYQHIRWFWAIMEDRGACCIAARTEDQAVGAAGLIFLDCNGERRMLDKTMKIMEITDKVHRVPEQFRGRLLNDDDCRELDRINGVMNGMSGTR